MIPVEDALETILEAVSPLGVESVSLSESLGRTLACEITARWANPPWDNSAMDGYALRAAETAGASKDAPVTLRVAYDLPAGSAPGADVGEGEAVRIMTGAPVPTGADAVVMVERTQRGDADGTVRIMAAARVGENIRKAGEDFQRGERVLEKGTLIRPAEIAMLATAGASAVRVYRRPRVAVISTGDELVETGPAPGPGKIPNSNGPALCALVAGCEAVPVDLGIAADTVESLREKLTEAQACDCIVSSGGVSVGDYDFVKDVLEELGSEMVFWKVAMKPGKPLAFGMIGGKPAFGLPGNPVSSMVAFEQFVRPALMKMAGAAACKRRTFRARLTEDIRTKPGRKNFIRAVLSSDEHGLCATPLEHQGSGMISTMVRANALIVVPADGRGFERDEIVGVEPLDSSILFEPTDPGS